MSVVDVSFAASQKPTSSFHPGLRTALSEDDRSVTSID